MRKMVYQVTCVLCLCAGILAPPACASIGTWLGGVVDAAPFHEDGYVIVHIDGVRYTVMKEAQVMIVTSSNGTQVKVPTEARQMRAGDSVTVQRSGNRIYAIEVNR